eukprot:scaffold4009_cov124-Cylindrotheca_fusiformis.AAC.18
MFPGRMEPWNGDRMSIPHQLGNAAVCPKSVVRSIIDNHKLQFGPDNITKSMLSQSHCIEFAMLEARHRHNTP